MKGKSEIYDPAAGDFRLRCANGLVIPNYDLPYAGKDPQNSVGGIGDGRVTEIARKLVGSPDVRGLTPIERCANCELGLAGQG